MRQLVVATVSIHVVREFSQLINGEAIAVEFWLMNRERRTWASIMIDLAKVLDAKSKSDKSEIKLKLAYHEAEALYKYINSLWFSEYDFGTISPMVGNFFMALDKQLI